MLDIKKIRKDMDNVVAALARRGFSFDREHFEQLDGRRKELDVRSQNLLAERKQASKQIGKLVREGVPVDEAKTTVERTLERLEQDLENAQQQARETQLELETFLAEHIGN